MESIYDLLLELPIFKGMGCDRLFRILERVHLDFYRVEPGEAIAQVGDHSNNMVCVLNGKYDRVHSLFGGSLVLRVAETAPNVIGVERLFGLDTKLRVDYIASSRCGLMSFSKKQYLDMLSADRIAMLNILNYLAAASHRMNMLSRDGNDGRLHILLRWMFALMSCRRDELLFIEGKDKPLLDLMGCNNPSGEKELLELIGRGVIDQKDPCNWHMKL